MMRLSCAWPVPVSLALAQAVIESGWGQSRFAAEGNALFGQWVWNDDMGIKARQASDSRASVRAFPDLQASVRAYMLNLNSFYAYEGFRRTEPCTTRTRLNLLICWQSFLSMPKLAKNMSQS